MKVKVLKQIQNEVNIEPGQVYQVGRKSMNYVRKALAVTRVVETKHGVYAVFQDGTWRPTSTYDRTWWKA